MSDPRIVAAEKLIAGLIGNPMLVPVVASMGLTDAHFPRGVGLQAPFRFAMAGPDCVERHATSDYEDLSHAVLRRLAKSRVLLTEAEAGALASYLLDTSAVRLAADRRPRVKAKHFLQDALRQGALRAPTVRRQARALGISGRTLRRAGKELGVVIQKAGFRGGWTWALPGDGH
jgi:hypothetical protein